MITVARVICDTNVWYEMGAGRLSVSKEVKLVATYPSLEEIASSTNIADKPSAVQNAVKAFVENGAEFIENDPFTYFLTKLGVPLKTKNDNAKRMIKEFDKLLKIPTSELSQIDDATKHKIRMESQKNRAIKEEWAAFPNAVLPKIRKNINKSTGKKEHKKIPGLEMVKEMMLVFFNDFLTKNGFQEIEMEDLNWDEIELFICVTETFFKELEINKDMKIKSNDAVDWLNMMYVGKHDKYLTLEKRWVRYIEQDSRVSHYLFQAKN